MSDFVTISIGNHVADVRLNRPEKLNALNMDMFVAITEALKRLQRETTVRAVVLSGEGKGFCAGLDMEIFAAMGSQDASKDGQSLVERYRGGQTNFAQNVAYGWKELPMPVIAAIQGACIGGGCQIALGADIRLATPDSKLSIRELHWGLIPDMSVTQTLRDLVSIDVAKELIYTAKIITGKEAAALNLVTRTCENPFEEAMTLAHEIANRSPHAIRAAKKLLNRAWHGESADGLLMESALESALIGKANNVEAIMANLANRPANFHDPE